MQIRPGMLVNANGNIGQVVMAVKDFTEENGGESGNERAPDDLWVIRWAEKESPSTSGLAYLFDDEFEVM